jgi:UDP-N-acetylmuramoyl-tripeptide--D-alanyl-D-alanine ligase
VDVIALSVLAARLGAPVPDTAPADRPVGPDVVIDSRVATPGSLFVALPGDRVDGHDYLGAAAEWGAVAAVVNRASTEPVLAEIVVADPARALADLARTVVADHPGLAVIGITGSSGKTSTKDLLAQILEADAPTVAPQGSFNNEIGVPLTALRIDAATRYLVSEMGARGIGHIAWLCGIVRPTVGVVVNVGTAHLGEFGGVAGIVAAKGELVEALPDDGWAVLNASDANVGGMAGRTAARLAWFSNEGRPDAEGALLVWAEDVVAEGERYGFTLCAVRPGTQAVADRTAVSLSLVGRHHVANALAAATAALAVGVPLEAIGAALSTAQPRSRWRMEVTERPDGVLVVNDAYNANPDSMRAALSTAAGLLRDRRAVHPGARLVAVLGDMLELGDASAAEHAALGTLAARSGVSTVLAMGAFAEQVVSRASAGGVDAVRVDSHPEAVAHLTELRRGDIVLLKASRGVGLDIVAAALLEEPC